MGNGAGAPKHSSQVPQYGDGRRSVGQSSFYGMQNAQLGQTPTRKANGHMPYPMQQPPYPAQRHAPAPWSASGLRTVPGYEQDPTTGQLYATPVPVTTEISSSDDSGDEAIDMNEVSEKRDRIYMMVLSADEFLGRKAETEARIHTLSQAEERELHMKSIQDSLGLRGHLQDELLRIEQMLAKDDPKLKCLKSFKQDYPGVVRAMKELRKKQRLIDEKAVSIELPTVTTGTETETSGATSASSQTTSTSPNTDTGIQTGEGDVQASLVATSQAAADTEIKHPTEEDLKKQHDEEEKILAAKFAQKLVHRPTVTSDDVNQVLSEHAIGMQALRNRQQAERQQWKDRVQLKMLQRIKERNKEKENEDDVEEGHDSSKNTLIKPLLPPIQRSANTELHSRIPDDASRLGMIAENDNKTSKVKANGDVAVESDDSGDEENDSFDDATLEELLARNASHNKSSTHSDDFEMDSDEERTVQENTTNAMWSQMKLKHRTTAQDLQDMMKTIKADEVKKSVKRPTSSKLPDDQAQTTKESTVFSLVLRRQESKDSDFVEKLSRKKKRGDISDQEFLQMIEKHLEASDRFREYQEKEKRKYEERLKAKLSDRANSDKDYSAEAEKDTKTQEELDELETKLKQDLLRRKDELSESEFIKLLEEYRRKQLMIVKKRADERARLDEKLKAKLDAKKNHEQGSKEQIPESTADEDFWLKLQEKQATGELTKEEFSQLLASYMQREKKHKRRKRAEGNTAADKQKASELLEQHQKQTKQIQGLLKAEKDKTDNKLMRRLEAKKKQRKRIVEVDSDDET